MFKYSKYFFVGFEIIFWLLVLAYMLFNPIYNFHISEVSNSPFWDKVILFVQKNVASVFMAFFCIIFPFIFYVIFKELPVAFLIDRLKSFINSINGQTQQPIPSPISNITNHPKSLVESTDLEYLILLIKESHLFADKILGRANLYLFLGVMIAIIGVGFYSIQITSSQEVSNNKFNKGPMAFEVLKAVNNNNSLINKEGTITFESFITEADSLYNKLEQISIKKSNFSWVAFLQKLGTLLFIELVAFFFLRQYRTTMDEYRYFDAIKRNNQNNLLLLKLSNNQNNKEDTETIINHINLALFPDKLKKEETTELLEKQKLSKNDAGLIGQIIELIKQLK